MKHHCCQIPQGRCQVGQPPILPKILRHQVNRGNRPTGTRGVSGHEPGQSAGPGVHTRVWPRCHFCGVEGRRYPHVTRHSSQKSLPDAYKELIGSFQVRMLLAMGQAPRGFLGPMFS